MERKRIACAIRLQWCQNDQMLTLPGTSFSTVNTERTFFQNEHSIIQMFLLLESSSDISIIERLRWFRFLSSRVEHSLNVRILAHTHTHSHLRHVQSLFRLLLLYLKRDQIDFNSRSIQNRFAKSPIGAEDRGQLVAVGSLNFRHISGAHAVSVSLLRIMLNLEVTTTIVCPAEICVKFVILSVYHLFPKVLTRKPQLCSLYSASRRKSDQNHPIDTLFIHNYARK